MSRARSRSMPLWLRRGVVLRGEPLAQLRVGGAQHPGVGEVDAEHRGPCRDRTGLAEERQVGDRCGAARCRRPAGSRSSSPSGSTMWRRSATARSRSWCSNISGVTTWVTGHLEPVEQQLAVDVLVEERQRGGDLARRVLVEPAPDRVEHAPSWSLVSRSVATIGIVAPSPSIRRPTWSGSGEAAAEDDARHLREVGRHLGGQHAEHDLGPVARRDDDGAVEEPVEDVGQRHRRHQYAGRLLRQQTLLAADQGARRRPPSGRRPTARSAAAPPDREGRDIEADQRVDDRVAVRRVRTVGNDGEQRAVVGARARPPPRRRPCAADSGGRP